MSIMANPKDIEAVETPEQKIARLEKESAQKDELIKEMNEASKATVAVPTVKVGGKTYKILVPTFYDGKDIVKTEDLPEEILKGQIGEALIEV